MVMMNENITSLLDARTMMPTIVVHNRGGGSIIKHASLFSSDAKYVFILTGENISAYSVQTGECAHQFIPGHREQLVSMAVVGYNLLSVSSNGLLTTWNTSNGLDAVEETVKIPLEFDTSVAKIYPILSKSKVNNIELVIAVKKEGNVDLSLMHYSTKKGVLRRNLFVWVEDNPQSVAVSDDYVATFKKDRLTVVSFNSKLENTSDMPGHKRWWTVVASESSGKLAAGDNTGRVVLWHNARQMRTKSVYHWHTLPVNTLVFSPSGTYMYSGGGEGVMVRWNLEAVNVRHFLPRLPAPIVHLSVSADNQYVAVATLDNGIQVVDGYQMKVCCVVQRLSWGVTATKGQQLFPAGLVWDAKSRCIVLNGRPGHLQFFNSDDNKLLYNLDITGQNLLTQERVKEIVNAEVSHVAISHDGKWMVTVETRDDHDLFLETLLKFWQYKFNARQFSLNTCVQMPHQGYVNSIRFQPPTAELRPEYMLASTGSDGKFRLWVPVRSESIHSEGVCWGCESVGCYREWPPTCISFSTDGSVLGVTFGPSLTLWDSEGCNLKTSLTRDNQHLINLEFGSGQCCHLVVTASNSSLSVWSVLTLSLVWTVPVQASLLCADPLSTNMALFTEDNSVFVFSPSNSKPAFIKKELCRKENWIIAGIFIPRRNNVINLTAGWCANSQLHFIDNNQELHYLELESECEPEAGLVRAVSESLATPFSAQAAQRATGDVRRQRPAVHGQLGALGDAAVRQLLSSPASTMPHIHLLCGAFLSSLAVTRRKVGLLQEKEDSLEDMEVDLDSVDSEEDDRVPGTSNGQSKTSGLAEISNSEKVNLVATKKGIKETPSKKKQRRKPLKERKFTTRTRKEQSFSIDDLDADWLSVLENR